MTSKIRMAVGSDHHIIFLHGFLKKSYELFPASVYFRFKGYKTHCISYKTHGNAIENIADSVWQKMHKRGLIGASDTVHFVAHSMGGLVVHALIKKYNPANLGRVVMWGTPLQGTILADYVDGRRWLGHMFRKLGGQAGQQLMHRYNDPERQIPVNYDLGIIAGNSARGYIFSEKYLGPKGTHDGIVPLESTWREGVKERLVLPVSHTAMLISPQVYQQTLRFLKNGHF
jgi:pimeloyl-ACP methyl ester carboxylesterase